MTVNRKTKQIARETANAEGIPYLQALNKIRKLHCENTDSLQDFSLNSENFAQSLLNARTGNHVIAGKTGNGKTTFTASIAEIFLNQGKTVSWFNPTYNEMPIFSESFDNFENFVYAYSEIDDLTNFLKSDLIIYDEVRHYDEKYFNLFLRYETQMLMTLHGDNVNNTKKKVEHQLGTTAAELIDSYNIVSRRTPQTESGLEISQLIDMNDQKNYQAKIKDSSGKVISVISPRGGSGKTSVALTLAAVLAEESNTRVAVVDLDILDGQIGIVTGNFYPTMRNLHKQGLTEDTLEKTLIYVDGLGVDVLLPPKRDINEPIINEEFYMTVVELLKKKYDYVILDHGILHNYITVEQAKIMADLFLVVTGVSTSIKDSLERLTDELTHGENTVAAEKIIVVMNKSIKDTIIKAGEIMRSVPTGSMLLSPVPMRAKLFAEAANSQTIETVLTDPEIHEAISRIAKYVKK